MEFSDGYNRNRKWPIGMHRSVLTISTADVRYVLFSLSKITLSDNNEAIMNTTNFEAEVISCCDMEYNLMCILGIDMLYVCLYIRRNLD